VRCGIDSQSFDVECWIAAVEDSDMAKHILDAAQKTVVKAAKAGAEGVKDVASDALGAAASAAAGVVLGQVSEALGSGQKKEDETVPAAPQAVSANTTRSRRKPANKRLTTKEGAAPKARAAKKRSAAKKKAGQASRNKTSATTKGTAGKAKKKAARGRR
jgi:hypothetical protein